MFPEIYVWHKMKTGCQMARYALVQVSLTTWKGPIPPKKLEQTYDHEPNNLLLEF